MGKFVIYKKFNTDTLIKYEDQDSNDFEKVLRYCRERNIDNNLIVGFHGGELEHTLNNWSVFSRYSKYMSLVIYDYDRYGFIINNSSKIKLKNDGWKIILIWECEIKKGTYKESLLNILRSDQ